MAASKNGLDHIRQEIDRIDRSIHDLLMERGRLISDLQAVKGVSGERGSSAIRPAREARMMRALAARHSGPLPLLAMERIWREIISAFTQLQAGFCVHAGGAEREILAELGRFYFGATSPLTLESSIQSVVTRVETDIHAVGLIAAPLSEWWMDLATIDGRSSRIVARVPFLDHADVAPIWRHEGWLVSQAPFEPSDHDRSLAVIRSDAAISRDQLGEAIRTFGLATQEWRLIDQAHEGGIFFALLELRGYQTIAEIPLSDALEISFLGGYGIVGPPGQTIGESDE